MEDISCDIRKTEIAPAIPVSELRLKRAGTSVIADSWHSDAQAHAVEIDLAQTQPGEVYRLPLEVLCSGKVEKMEMVQRR